MLGSLFGGGKARGATLRPMRPEDVDQVLHIIALHDEDDAEEAAETFSASLDGMYVLEDGRWVVGVTGAAQDPDTPDVFWLSWTYLAEHKRGTGLGQEMIDQLGQMLVEAGCRKVFITTSDYVDDEDGDVYADARAFYEENMGARLEVKIPDYYEVGESQLIYGAILSEGAVEDDEDDEDAEDGDDDAGDRHDAAADAPLGPLTFDGLADAPETDDGAALTWRALSPGETAPATDAAALVKKAKDAGARFALVVAPADLVAGASERLKAAGFERIGALSDYDKPGLDREVWRAVL